METNYSADNKGMNDFGFLSDPKLLNTALTRAQSFVGVIGDPVVLCAVGECTNVWRTYLKHCENMKSLIPHEMTLAKIKQQVSDLLNMNASARDRMQQISNMQQPIELLQADDDEPSYTEAGPSQIYESPTRTPNSLVFPPTTSLAALAPPPISSHDNKFDDKMTRYPLNPDTVLRQLISREDSRPRGGLDIVHVKDMDGKAVVSSTNNWADLAEGDDEDDIHAVKEEYSEIELKDMMMSEPERYKLCVLKVKSGCASTAVVQSSQSTISQLEISTETRRGPAFNLDLVTVEVLAESSINEDSSKPQGRVVGILKRHLDPNGRNFVCTVEPGNAGVLVPINSGISKIYNLSSACHLDKIENGNVCVYKLGPPNGVTFHRYVNATGPLQEHLFLVRYLKWSTDISAHVGIVIGCIASGLNEQLSLQALNIDNYIPNNSFPDGVEHEIANNYPAHYCITENDLSHRNDLRQSWTFSISSSTSTENSIAVSIDQVSGDYSIGVHVMDVPHYVQKDSKTDIEAKQRGMSYELLNDTIHMLPTRLSTDLCNLIPGQDRLATSILLTVSQEGSMKKVQAIKSIINTKKNFTYQEVQESLSDPDAASDYLKSCVLVLYHIATLWRKERLGNLSKYLDMKLEDKLTAEAHIIQEELVIMTNRQIAKLLLNRFPHMTPLFCQAPPHQVAKEQWKMEYATDAVNAIALTQPFLEGNSTCNCKLACTCIMNHIRKQSEKPRDPFIMNTVWWDSICQATDQGSIMYAHSIITSAENHPQLVLALQGLEDIQNEDNYISSGVATGVVKGHYKLNVEMCVNFTQPVSSYMDIVAHRLVSCLISNQTPQYDPVEIQSLCDEMSSIYTASQRYKAEVFNVDIGHMLKRRPLVLHPVLSKIEDDKFSLSFPGVKSLSEKCIVPIANLNTKAVTVAKGGKELTWRNRIYEQSPVKQLDELKSSLQILNPCRFICKIPAFQWQKLLSSIREDKNEKLLTAITAVRPNVKHPKTDPAFCEDLTAEAKVNGILQHFTDFSLSFTVSDVIQVQLTPQTFKGIKMPFLQTLSLTNTLEICLEHRNQPELVFCTDYPSTSLADKTSYIDESDYVKSWQPVIALEAASNAVNNSPVIIKKVPLAWQQTTQNSKPGFAAVFSLSLAFVIEHHLLPRDLPLSTLLEDTKSLLSRCSLHDFLCIRYNDINIPEDASLKDGLSVIVNNSQPVCWVGHCLISDVEVKDASLVITASLTQSSVQFPSILLAHEAQNLPCTMEWISKGVSDR